MTSIDRRTFLIGSAVCASLAITKNLVAQVASDSGDAKQLFISAANKQWMAAHKIQEDAAREHEKFGEFASLSPPKELVPFKDWDFYYLKGSSEVWTPDPGQKYQPVVVPVGFVTDLASIPKVFWSSGLRPEGSYAYAAIVHDYLYWTQDRPREEADNILREAMQDSKVGNLVLDAIYRAVRLAGESAWKNNAKLKASGEKRILREFPTDFTISWEEWKKRPGVFKD
jgi:Protein of unknown function (DUF1353).